MSKYLPIFLYGSILILSGVFMLFSAQSTYLAIKFTLGSALILSAIFAFISAFTRQRQKVQFAYHNMHAMTMLINGIILIAFCNSPENFMLMTSFLFFFYAFSEIILANWLFNLAQKVVFKIIFIRVFLGLLIGIGAVVAMNFEAYTLLIFGILYILIGINILLYVPVMKATESIYEH